MSSLNIPVPMAVSCDIEATQMSVKMKQTNGATSITDKKPYLRRASAAGSADVAVDKIIGGTVAWNQQMREMSSTYYVADGSSTVSISDGVATVTPSARYGGIRASNNNLPQNIDGHKMLAVASVLSDSMSVFISMNEVVSRLFAPSQGWQTVYVLINADSSNSKNFRVRVNDASNFSAFYVKNCMAFDLTAMFGSTIADYVYALESGTEGAGIAWLESYGFLTKPYYAYDVGGLQSVKTSAHIIRDDNENVIGDYALDSDLELRGIPKLDASNNLYYDGDTYEADGTVTRRYGIVDLGTLTWSKYNVTQGTLFRSSEISGAKIATGSKIPNIICKYVAVIAASRAEMTVSCSVANKVDIIDSTYSESTAAQFKTAMSGVYLVYELATPTTESADSYTNPQKVSAEGTEEYVDARDVPIPVGHETKYVTRQTTETAFDAYPMTVTQGVEV